MAQKKGYKTSEETKKKISKAMKGCASWMKGKHHSAKTKKKISLSEKGKVISEEQREKLSIALKGCIPWNKGKKHTKSSTEKISKTMKKLWKSKEFRDKTIKAHSGDRNSRWRGGRRKTVDGYIEVLNHQHPFSSCEGYIAEHRIIVEKQIKRYLTSIETVHHLGKRADNRPQMLMAFVNHSIHKRFENGSKIEPSQIIFDGRKIPTA